MTDNANRQSDGPACGCGGGSCCSGPGRWIWIILLVAIAGVLIAKNAGKKDVAPIAPAGNAIPAAVEAVGTAPAAPEVASEGKGIPRLVDLGSTKCIPCKMMAPILVELRSNYVGTLSVEFIDVWENPDAGKKYGINVIPTQIFFDAQGRELFRHEGFFGKADILAKWKEFGVELPVPKEESSR